MFTTAQSPETGSGGRRLFDISREDGDRTGNQIVTPILNGLMERLGVLLRLTVNCCVVDYFVKGRLSESSLLPILFFWNQAEPVVPETTKRI